MTEALHFYNAPTTPSKKWIQEHYSHFEPKEADYEARKKYQQMLKKKNKAGDMVSFDLFE